MKLAAIAFVELGMQAMQNDLSANLAIFITWQLTCGAVIDNHLGIVLTESQINICEKFIESQLFVFTSMAQNVFEISNSVSSMSNVDLYCNATSTTSYSVVSAVSSVIFNYPEFISNPMCSGIADPSIFGYDTVLHNNDFSIDIDVRTFGDAIGINFGYLLAIELEYVGNAGSNTMVFEYQNVNYTTDAWIDTVYAGMLPLFCVTNTSEVKDPTKGLEQLCFMQFHEVIGLPFFNHYGNTGGNMSSIQTPQPCYCDTGWGHEEYCDKVDLMMSKYNYFI